MKATANPPSLSATVGSIRAARGNELLDRQELQQRGERAEIQRVEVALNIGPMRRALSTPGLGVNFCGRPTWTSAV